MTGEARPLPTMAPQTAKAVVMGALMMCAGTTVPIRAMLPSWLLDLVYNQTTSAEQETCGS